MPQNGLDKPGKEVENVNLQGLIVKVFDKDVTLRVKK